MNQRPLVSVEWLESQRGDKNLCIVDGSWHMPAEQRDAQAEYSAGHIPGAVFFDIDEHSAAGDLPHMMPQPLDFAESAGALGLLPGNTVVVYDTKGLFSAARVWWMLRTFGFSDVKILDGGLPAWSKAGLPLDSGKVALSSVTPAINFAADAVVDASQVLAASDSRSAQILDARSQGRFDGVDPEPRAGLRGGHIPNSVCLPFTELLDSDARLKSNEALAAVFDSLGIDGSKPVITSCGSGVTAAILTLGLYCIGRNDIALYDGSWTEWGGRSDLPVGTAVG